MRFERLTSPAAMLWPTIVETAMLTEFVRVWGIISTLRPTPKAAEAAKP